MLVGAEPELPELVFALGLGFALGFALGAVRPECAVPLFVTRLTGVLPLLVGVGVGVGVTGVPPLLAGVGVGVPDGALLPEGDV